MKLKTRTNQPVYYKLPVSSNMEQLSDGLLNSLKVGDVVQKKTGNQKHCYIVTYKEEGVGICLTYVDGSGYMETISYDYTGGHWVYNSKDVTQAISESSVKALIQADKDILSKIEIVYDSVQEKTRITFPKNIMPLVINSDIYVYYFDYSNLKVYADEFRQASLIGDIIVNNEIVVLELNNVEENKTNIRSIEYILFSKDTYALNTYYLYNPITSGGTKLYQHLISLQNPKVTNVGGGQPFKLKIINNVSTPLTSRLTSDVLLFIEDTYSYFVGYSDKYKIISIRYAGPSPIIRFIGTQTSDNVFSIYEETLDISDTTNFTDTVTEL